MNDVQINEFLKLMRSLVSALERIAAHLEPQTITIEKGKLDVDSLKRSLREGKGYVQGEDTDPDVR